EACIRHGKFLLHFSTSEVYGKTGGSDAPFKEGETDCILGPVANHRWIYSSAKQLLDRIIHAHGQAGTLDYVIVRPFNFIGPLMDDVVPHWTREDNPRVLANFMSALIYGRPIRLVDGGRSRRCFTYIEDALTAIELLIRRRQEVSRQIVNIGNPDNETTIADLAERLVAIYRDRCDRAATARIEDVSAAEFYGPGYEDCDRRVPDISKLRLLGWAPRFGLDETLTRSAVYFYENRARLEGLLAAAAE
ncbi:MAG: NAD-dependent epimerase/dehydratase family protein, partial [Bauldia sp.]